jgi:hypothetical protein
MTKQQKQVWECPLQTCRERVETLVPVVEAPWCNKETHSKKMKLVVSQDAN